MITIATAHSEKGYIYTVIDAKHLLYRQMVRAELSKSKKNGCTLKIPFHRFGEAYDVEYIDRQQREHRLNLPSPLINLYQNMKHIQILWTLFEEAGDERDNTDRFKNDPWLKEHYFDTGYSWDVVKEYLGGSIFISSLDELLNQHPESSYYVVLEAMGMNPAEYRLFDAQQRATALLKVEDGTLADRIWLIDVDARQLYDMGLSVEEYLSVAYRAKLFHAWQLTYVLREKTPFFELMKRYLPMLTPHMELDLKAFGI